MIRTGTTADSGRLETEFGSVSSSDTCLTFTEKTHPRAPQLHQQ